MPRFLTPGRIAALLLALTMPAAEQAAAHPHMWIDARAWLVFDGDGRLAALRQAWRFDEMSSAYSLQGLPRSADGGYAPKALQSMADDWVAALGEPQSHYFTWLRYRGRSLEFGTPAHASVQWDKTAARVTLVFELPLQTPVAPAGAEMQMEVFDPTYFVAYAFDAPGAIELDGAPRACRSDYRPPQPLDPATALRLAAIPADAEIPPGELSALTQKLSHRIGVRCP